MHKILLSIKKNLAVHAKPVIITVFLGVISSIIATQIINSSQKSYQIGEIILLGSYEQDNNLDNGKEKIEWIVLDENNGTYLLMSRYILDAHAYNDIDTPVSWETCTLRAWLNDNFLREAFSEKEQKKLFLFGDYLISAMN